MSAFCLSERLPRVALSCCLLLSSLHAVTAEAADIPVRYDVSAKSLKDNVTGASELTFEYYSDSGW